MGAALSVVPKSLLDKHLMLMLECRPRIREDLSGMQLSGNKVRKLEFLLADAVAEGADCIITFGAIQSNHCRATAVAAKYLNLDCYLILITSEVLLDRDPGLSGNLLVERLVGAHIDLVSEQEFTSIGSVGLTNLLKERLLSKGRKPYVIPAGGCNSLATWGYIETIREIKDQLQKRNCEVAFDDIVVACGSGGTVAGLSVGSWLSDLGAKVNTFISPSDMLPHHLENRSSYIDVYPLLARMSSSPYDGSSVPPLFLEEPDQSRTFLLNSSTIAVRSFTEAKGLGCDVNTTEELTFIKEIAEATGVVLDPVYSGKAAYGMMRDMAENPKKWEGRKVLFTHTGGLLGLFDKTEQMAPLIGNWHRMDTH
ncbi:hypothetical protein DH2020_039604 [Rehmannia glutinosa]|uniref:Tryptophan synthase beta chain-like PALP domain-containing protein n=1 Tax=Rehmannia glutinosa TaxID=99300 RepID=A0ABR0UX33_REHGL